MAKTKEQALDLITYGLSVGYFYIEEGTGQLYISTKSNLNYEQLISGYKMELERDKKRLKELKQQGKG